MSEAFLQMKRLTMWGYILTFSALSGFLEYGPSSPSAQVTHQNTLLIWVGSALVGSIIVVIRNRKIIDPRQRRLITTVHQGITLVTLGITFAPGMVLGLRLTVLFSVLLLYISWTVWYLYKRMTF